MPFEKGQSGNPSGRPPGVGRVTELRRMLLSRSGEVVTALLDRAVQGDVGAIKLIVDRLIPALRPINAPVSLPRADSDNPSDQAKIIVSHLLSGGLPADLAAQIMQALQSYHQMVVLTDMEKRIAALESSNGNNSSITGSTE